jgi:Autotransporter beta-domain
MCMRLLSAISTVLVLSSTSAMATVTTEVLTVTDTDPAYTTPQQGGYTYKVIDIYVTDSSIFRVDSISSVSSLGPNKNVNYVDFIIFRPNVVVPSAADFMQHAADADAVASFFDGSPQTAVAGPTTLNAGAAGPLQNGPYQLVIAPFDQIGDGGDHTVTFELEGVGFGSAPQSSSDEDVIRSVLHADAERSLRSQIASNRKMVIAAKERFVNDQSAEATVADVPLDFAGSFEAQNTTISSKGTFFGLTNLSEGHRRLVFGDLDVQRDGETGSSTATLNGKVAWEQSVSDKTLLGYFIGGELARSNIAGSFEGSQNRFGVSVGGYAVHELAHQIYLDGFLSLGAGRNNLSISDGVLDLDSDYTTRSATLGAAVSGVIEQKGFEVWPEVSFSLGRTWLGDVDFTGSSAISLDAGTVTLANILFRPEVRVPMDGLSGAESLQLFTFAPRLICEQVRADVIENDCGAGAEFGFSGNSADGLSIVSAKVMADRVDGSTNSSVQLNLKHRF